MCHVFARCSVAYGFLYQPYREVYIRLFYLTPEASVRLIVAIRRWKLVYHRRKLACRSRAVIVLVSKVDNTLCLPHVLKFI